MARSKDQRCISSPGDEIRWLTAGLRTTDPSPVAERHPAASGRQVATRRRYADAVSQTANHGWVAPAKRLAGCLSWYWGDMSSTAKNWLWRVGISISGLGFLSLFATWFGPVRGEDFWWTGWAVGAVLDGLLVQSISFFGRPRSPLVLLAWLLIAVGLPFTMFGLFNPVTFLCLVLAQLVVLLEHQRKPLHVAGQDRP